MKTCLAFISSVQTLRMKFLQKNFQYLLSLTGEKQERSIGCSLRPCHAFPAVNHCSTFSCFQVCESESTNRYTHYYFFFYLYLYSVHTHPHYQKNLKICTPVGLVCCCKAQSKFSAYFFDATEAMRFFLGFILWTILACFYTWLMVCASAKSWWNTHIPVWLLGMLCFNLHDLVFCHF